MEIFSCYNHLNKDCDLTFAYTECRVFCVLVGKFNSGKNFVTYSVGCLSVSYLT